MSERTVGTCGNCGGAVTVLTAFLSVVPPVPRCRKCGSVPRQAHGPTIEMAPAPRDRGPLDLRLRTEALAAVNDPQRPW